MKISNLLQIKKISPDDLYKMLDNFESSLNLDVGGFVGNEAIKLSCNNKHRVISFEPFKNNIPFFVKNTKDFDNITLINKAVGKSSGKGYLGGATEIVDSKKNNWSDAYVGGSAVGSLNSRSGIPVETCRISDVVQEHVLMMKIDIQGGEYNCLLGCEELIDNHGIDMMVIEFTGNLNIINFLHEKGYVLFDSEYVQWGAKNDTSEFKNKNVTAEKVYRLSNGLHGRKIFYENRPSELRHYLSFLCSFTGGKKDFLGQQTDLFCVHNSFMEQVKKILNNDSAR